jgi:hypothetical protein
MLTDISFVVAFCPELVACLENGTSELSAYDQVFLGAFAATISFMSVRPSAWNNSAPGRRIFMKFDN